MEPQSVMTAVPQDEEEVPSREAHLESQEAPACDRAPRTRFKISRCPRWKMEYEDDFNPPPRPASPNLVQVLDEATKPPAKSLRVKEAMMSLARSLTVEEALDLLSKVWSGNEMKATVRHTKKAIMVTSVLIAIGGLVGGPPGLAVGGTVGVLIGTYMSWGKFKSVPQMLKELTPTEKKKLRSQVMAIVKDLKGTNIEELTEQVMANKAVQEKLLKLTMSFVTHKMGNA